MGGNKIRESDIVPIVRLAADECDTLLWRNNVGLGWVGQIISKTASTITLKNPRPLHAGLCVGSSDFIGVQKKLITQDMVGTYVGVFVAPETKRPGGKPRPEQVNFMKEVNGMGGIAFVATCAEDVYAKLK